VPLHFTAFLPDYRMLDTPPTPVATLKRARDLALGEGLRWVYTGNLSDWSGGNTWCPRCRSLLIERRGYAVTDWQITPEDLCRTCGEPVPGRFAEAPGRWGNRRTPVHLPMAPPTRAVHGSGR
jgi:pyruvate formate lyase activating enzyme